MVKDAPVGYVKSSYASLRYIHRHCGVRKKYVSFLMLRECFPEPKVKGHNANKYLLYRYEPIGE
jgi:hypothetical protein